MYAVSTTWLANIGRVTRYVSHARALFKFDLIVFLLLNTSRYISLHLSYDQSTCDVFKYLPGNSFVFCELSYNICMTKLCWFSDKLFLKHVNLLCLNQCPTLWWRPKIISELECALKTSKLQNEMCKLDIMMTTFNQIYRVYKIITFSYKK